MAAIPQITKSQIDIINSRRTAGESDRYVDSEGNIWTGNKLGRLVVNPETISINSHTSDSTLEQRLAALEGVKNGAIEVNFGSELYQTFKTFFVTDSRVSVSSNILLSKVVKSSSDGRDADELLAETFEVSSTAKNGGFDLHVKSLNGSVTGTFIFAYSV